MTTILAIETAGVTCSVAINVDGEIHQQLETSPRSHAKKLMPMVDSILREFGQSLRTLDAIAFSQGPGSFTGLRIGFGVVQGLAFGADLPVIGVSTLQATAHRAMRDTGVTSGIIVPALDARMGELYWGCYEIDARGIPVAVKGDAAQTPRQVLEVIPRHVDVAAGEGWKLLPDHGKVIAHLLPEAHADAASLSELALVRFNEDQAVTIADAELRYIRNEISWKKRDKIRSQPGEAP